MVNKMDDVPGTTIQEHFTVMIPLFGIGDLSGGGGAERFFADVVHYYADHKKRKFSPILIVDEKTYKQLQEFGRLTGRENIRFIRGKMVSGLLDMIRIVGDINPAIIHIPLIAPQYLPFLLYVIFNRRKRVPAITMTQVDCSVANTLGGRQRALSTEQKKSLLLHQIYFRLIPLDGIYTWYRSFAELSPSLAIRGKPLIQSARFCFVDTEKFRPAEEKQNIIIFAGRLAESKGPFFFLEAIRRIINQDRDILSDWKIVMYGRGSLKNAVLEYIKRMRLDSIIEINESANLENIFPDTRLFVSSQQYENFTSLAMLEAMSCGNAVIARNVGQTDEFVRHGRNGYLLSEDNPGEMARTIIQYIRNPCVHRSFAAESRRLAVEYHNAENFVKDIENFWNSVIHTNNKK